MPRRERIRRDILKMLENHGTKSFRPKELAKRLDYTSNEDYSAFRDVLEDLRQVGAIASVKGGMVSYRSREGQLSGVLSVHPDGFGFVRVEGEDQDIFVRARRMNTAIDGDVVEISTSAPARGDRRRSGEVLRVLERSRTSAVGTLRDMGSYAVVIPSDLRLSHDIYVPREELKSASDGDMVVVSIDAFEDRRAALHGRILKVIGPSSDEAVQTLAVALSQGIHVDFPDEVMNAAEAIPDAVPEKEIGRRTDLRDELIFTIDPKDAKDFDDALHLRLKSNGQMELGVHIADVSYFVEEGSPIDAEAYRRGTSIYLVDRAIPMLPPRLSSNLCSLRPNEDRLAFSCIIDISAQGEVLSRRFEETVIRSRHRLTYEEAERVLEGEENDHEITAALGTIHQISRRLAESRSNQGSIDFGMTEVQIELDDTGHPIAIRPKKRLESHRLIEECMLLANRLVAEALIESSIDPVVSRIHEHPDRERIAQLASYVRSFGYELRHSEGLVSPGDLNALLSDVRGEPVAPVIEQAALRAMSKARYAIEPVGHYGLAFRHYTHFTSPIRRYPDLVVHRLVKRMLAGEAGMDASTLKQICDHTSERERVATEAERASIQLKQVVFAADHVGDEFDGVVTSVSKFGVYIELTDLLVEGMVHVRDMNDDYYEYDERTFCLIGLQSGKRYRPGDPVRVLLAAARIASREIDLAFVPSAKTGGKSRSGNNMSPSSRKRTSARPNTKSGTSSRRQNKGKNRRKR